MAFIHAVMRCCTWFRWVAANQAAGTNSRPPRMSQLGRSVAT